MPVTVGFLAGIAVHILVSQMPVRARRAGPGWTDAAADRGCWRGALAEANVYTVASGSACWRWSPASEAINARIPGALIGLVGATVAVIAAGLESKGVGVVGTVPATLPAPSVPDIAAEHWAKLMSHQSPDRHRRDGADGGHHALVSFRARQAGRCRPRLSRRRRRQHACRPVRRVSGRCEPAANRHRVETGGTVAISASLFAAAIVLALSAFGATLLKHVPGCGARRRPVVRGAAHHPLPPDRHDLPRSRLASFCLIVATAAAIVVLPIEQGVAIGIVLSLLHGIWSTTRARLVVFERVPGTTIWWPTNPHI